MKISTHKNNPLTVFQTGHGTDLRFIEGGFHQRLDCCEDAQCGEGLVTVLITLTTGVHNLIEGLHLHSG